MKQYDLIIIGSGGGTKLRPAATLGKKVAIIEKDSLGGTCLNRGCIPSKMLIYPADLITHWKEDKERFFITGGDDISLNFKALVERTNQLISKDSESIKVAYEEHENVDFYHGHGRFTGPKTILVNDEEITAENIYIATGARPFIPNIPGLVGTPYMTSTEALKNTTQPKSMIVIGGGYIGVELGHFYGAVGTDVTFIVRSEMISAEDKDVRAVFTEDFSDRYNVEREKDITSVSYVDGTFHVETIDKNTGEAMTFKSDALLVATGVIHNSDQLGLEHTNVKLDSRGRVIVNDHLETDEQGVYAFGDVVGNFYFRHSANFEGEYLFGQHYGEKEQKPIDYSPVPHAIFTYPQVAGVGTTEDALIKKGLVSGKDYSVAVNHYRNSAMGDAMQAETGFVKLISDKRSRKLIGAHIIGEKASDIVHMLIAYITIGATADQLLEMIYIHPALSENIRNAARKLIVQLDAEL